MAVLGCDRPGLAAFGRARMGPPCRRPWPSLRATPLPAGRPAAQGPLVNCPYQGAFTPAPKGTRDVEQSGSAVVADGQVQGAVQLAALAATGRFAAGTGARNQGAAQERLLGDQLGQLGTGVAFRGRALRAGVDG